jgi:hypothetical protein
LAEEKDGLRVFRQSIGDGDSLHFSLTDGKARPIMLIWKEGRIVRIIEIGGKRRRGNAGVIDDRESRRSASAVIGERGRDPIAVRVTRERE